MKGKAKTRRRLLFIVLTVIVLMDGIWLYSTSSVKQTPDFKLEITSTSIFRDPDSPGKQPVFDPNVKRWLFDGQRTSSVVPFVEDADPENIGPDSIGRFIVVQLSNDADMNAFRHALLALSLEGICQAAFLPTKAPANLDEAFVSRLIEVRGDDGRARRCRDNFNR